MESDDRAEKEAFVHSKNTGSLTCVRRDGFVPRHDVLVLDRLKLREIA
jgi:hypothetical protein